MVILGPTPSRFDPAQTQLSPERARVLEALQSRQASASVSDIAQHLSLHENTARKHLEGLVDRGLVVRSVGAPAGRGRPGYRYSARAHVTEPDARVREYVGLASALARHLADTSDDPRGDAIAVGEAWGTDLALTPPAGSAAQQPTLESLLEDLGFAPACDTAGNSMALRRCPLLDAAHAQPDVICAVHLGLARGIVAALGADPEPIVLEPFAEVGACRLHGV